MEDDSNVERWLAVEKLLTDAHAYGTYACFHHGTIVSADGPHFDTPLCELMEWVDVDADTDAADTSAYVHMEVISACIADVAAEHHSAFDMLYFGTFDPTAQCAVHGFIHICGGPIDVICQDGTNPYDVVELDRLFPKVEKIIIVREITQSV
jgi:hypothetical protein